MDLRCYVEDEEVKSALSEFGEVIRLKYKTDYELAGLEKGHRLVKMILDKPSIPYSLRICGEWCRSIHNNIQSVCIACSELGHTGRNCPKIRCRVCKQFGHMSDNCDQREEQDDETPDAQPEAKEELSEATGGQPQAVGGSDDIGNEDIRPNNINDYLVNKIRESRKEEMD